MKILFVYNNNSRAGMAVESETVRARVLAEQQKKWRERGRQKEGPRKELEDGVEKAVAVKYFHHMLICNNTPFPG